MSNKSRDLSASALPTKRFFIEMITRDISLEDAILDLIDNSIDSLIRSQSIDISDKILSDGHPSQAKESPPPTINVRVSSDSIMVTDECGGISIDHAINEVFRIGRPDDHKRSSLGVYGIGLKRAVFKIGKFLRMESRTESEGFEVRLDIDKWAKEQDWHIALKRSDEKAHLPKPGTLIELTRLNPEIVMRTKDGTLLSRVRDFIATTYSLFLRYVRINLNGIAILAKPIPLAGSSEIQTGIERFMVGEVSVTLMAGLASRRDGEWNIERAGWYVLCNGRAILFGDKGEMTGWGVHSPQFVSKFRGFIGVAFFFSHQPEELPWTTTKRGLNIDSSIFQQARNHMINLGKPVLSFLNRMYSGESEELQQRRIADSLQDTDIRVIAKMPDKGFEVKRSASRPVTTVNVQYKAELSDIERVKMRLKKPSWSAGKVGAHVLRYFIEQECPE